MTGFARIPIAEVLVDGNRPPVPSCNDEVWNLNLDQIESGSGKVLEKNRVRVGSLGPSTYPFSAGTVLYSKLRPYLNKVVLADEDGFATTELVSLRCNPDKMHAPYLAYYLRSPEFLSFANTVVAGAKMPRMVMSEFWRYQMPVPSLPEQRRIAATLDQADVLREKRREALVLLDDLKRGIFIEMFGDLSDKPLRFATSPLQELLKDGFQNGAYFPKEAYVEGGVEMVHMSDAFGGGIKRGNLKRVQCSSSDADKYSLTVDDLIIARRSLTYDGAARPCMVPESDEPLIFESSFIRVRADKKRVLPLFLFHYLNNNRVREKFVRPYVTQSTISGINQSNLSKIPVLIPPITLQIEFNERVAAIESIGQKHGQSLTELNSLFASLEYRAFGGNL